MAKYSKLYRNAGMNLRSSYGKFAKYGHKTKREDKPQEGKQYLLIGGTDKPSIANGNSWEESEVNE